MQKKSDTLETNPYEPKNHLLTYLLTYLADKKTNNNNYNFTTRVSRELVQEFFDTCRRLGLITSKGYANKALAALIAYFNEQFKDSPKTVQTNFFYKPTVIQQQNIVNIAVKLQLKMVKKDLTFVLQKLELKELEQQARNFQLSRLREVLPKAISAYEKTANKELETLLQKAEAYV
jgi:hypothetical protein